MSIISVLNLVLPQDIVSQNVIKMKKDDYFCGTAANAAIGTSGKSQPIENLAKEAPILYDLVDLTRMFKVTKRTLFNWRGKGIINLIDFGGKLYMTHAMYVAHIQQRGGVI